MKNLLLWITTALFLLTLQPCSKAQSLDQIRTQLAQQRDAIISQMQSSSITQSQYSDLKALLDRVYDLSTQVGIGALGFRIIPPPFHGSSSPKNTDSQLLDLERQMKELSDRIDPLKYQLSLLKNQNPKTSPNAFSIYQELRPLEKELFILEIRYRGRKHDLGLE